MGQKRGRGRPLRRVAESSPPVAMRQSSSVPIEHIPSTRNRASQGLATERESQQATEQAKILARQHVEGSASEKAVLSEEKHEAEIVDRPTLCRRLLLNYLDQRNVPAPDSRQGSFASLTASQQRAIIRVLDRVLFDVAKDLVPNDAEHVVAEFKTRKRFNTDLLRTVVKGIHATPRGSTERRTLRAYLCATTAADEVRSLLACDDNEAYVENSAESDQRNIDTPSIGQLTESRHVGVAVKGSPLGTSTPIESVCATPVSAANSGVPVSSVENSERAVVCVTDLQSLGTADEVTDQSVVDPNSATDGNAENDENIPSSQRTSSKRKISGSFQRMFSRSRAEWNYIMTHGSVPPTVKRSVKRVDDNTLRVVLQFLLRPENLRLTSNGAKRIRQGAKWTYFPAFLRRTACDHMFRNYVMYVNEKLGPSGPTIGRTTFIRIIQMLTRAEEYRSLAADHFTSVLVRGNLDTVRRIIRSEVRDVERRDELLEAAAAVEDYLRFVHITHISSDTDPAHNIDHGLLYTAHPGAQLLSSSSCKLCLTPFQFIQNVQSAVGFDRPELTAALNSARNKTFLYMGHHMRCLNQGRTVSEVFLQLASYPPGSAAVLLMDFRERIELIRLKEKVVEMHGRKGMSWHGTLAFLRRASSLDLHRVSGTTPEELSTYFLNHVVSDDTVQDGITASSILEAVLARLRVEYPGLKQVWILSDDSKCYQNVYLPVIAPFIAHEHGMRLQAYIYTELAQSKAVMDSHFGTAMDRVNRFCKEMKQDVTAPADLSRAIGYRGGVFNSTVELIQVNRNKPRARKWLDAEREGRLPRMERVDKIVYDKFENGDFHASMFKYIGAPPSNWQLGFCYSQWCGGEPVDADDLMEMNEATTDIHDESGNITEVSEIFTGLVTDVTVLTRTPIRRSACKGVVRAVAAIDDALAELCGDEEVEGNEQGDEKEVESVTDSQLPMCQRCGRLYLYFSALEVHKTKCSGPAESGIVQDRVPVIAQEFLNSQDLNAFSPKVGSLLTEMELADDTESEVQFRPLWAQRLPRSQSLGENTVMKYSNVINDWFDRGHRGRKISANGMLNQLILDRPWCYDFPAEHHISQYLYSIARDHRKPAWTAPGGRGRGRRGMPQKYVHGLERLLRGTPNLKPKDARGALVLVLDLDENSLPVDFPSEQALKNKVSNLKWNMKELEARNESAGAACRRDEVLDQSLTTDAFNQDANPEAFVGASTTASRTVTHNASPPINTLKEAPPKNLSNLNVSANIASISESTVHLSSATPNIIPYSTPSVNNHSTFFLSKTTGPVQTISIPPDTTTLPSPKAPLGPIIASNTAHFQSNE